VGCSAIVRRALKYAVQYTNAMEADAGLHRGSTARCPFGDVRGFQMFSEALELAGRFTIPYVGMRRRRDGVVFSTVATCIAVTSDGWMLTSAHVLEEIARAEASVRGALGIEGRLEEARRAHRQRDVSELQKQLGTSLSSHVEIWAIPGFATIQPRVVEHHVDKEKDLALVRLDPFDSSAIGDFPVFRGREHPITPGTSVCRLGYPFHTVEATYDEERRSFDITSGFPVPRFALDGIVSRFQAVKIEGREERATFIETSSPGLRGQSGGPLLDAHGRVCGVQSHTAHLDLGFDARYERDGEPVLERQFLNVGRAAHIEGVLSLLEEHGVSHRTG